MSWIKKCLFLGIGIFISLFFAVVILELLFGSWLGDDPWRATRGLNILRDTSIKFDLRSADKNSTLKSTYTRDHFGLRGSCKDVSHIEILTIGGSTTDQRWNSDGSTYQDVLQSLLSEKIGRQICISNAGVDGHSTFGHLKSFESWFSLINGLSPKYYLLYIGINDAGFREGPADGFDNAEVPHYSALRNIIRQKSALYGLVVRLRNFSTRLVDNPIYASHLDYQFKEKDYVVSALTPGVEIKIAKNSDAFEKRLRAMLSHIRSRGALPICVSQPHLYAKKFEGKNRGLERVFQHEKISYNGLDYEASINALSKVMKTSCVESAGYFIDIGSKKFLDEDFYNGVHMTNSGVRRLGEYLYEEFAAQKIPF
jgi:lysophospholipase L1-like esterase